MLGGRTMKESQSSHTLLCGREFTAQEIQDIQETIESCCLSWYELLQTICEHLEWVTPAGRYKVDSCAKALKKLEALGVVKLPLKRACQGSSHRIDLSERTDPQNEVRGTVRDFAPIKLRPVTVKDEMRLWDEYVERYHVLGYKRPFGAHQRYFIEQRAGQPLGCLLFASSAWALAERDQWIGWSEHDRAQRLNWVVANTRFLIFPWVRVRNLASTALSLAARRIGQDWQERYGYAPVLLETFVDVERYRGTCTRRPTGSDWERRPAGAAWIDIRNTCPVPRSSKIGRAHV